MNPIIDEQQRRNRQSRDSWHRFGPHRSRLSRLLVEFSQGRGDLCVLGAGNCNDLELTAMLECYDQVHLVDLDAAALRDGVARQGSADSRRITLHGGVDLSGLANLLARSTPRNPLGESELEECFRRAETASPLGLPAEFQTAASVCLLTQLLETVDRQLGEAHPRAFEMKTRIRAGHFKQLVDLVRPGGTAVVVLDFVSSLTCPELAETPAAKWAETALRLLRERNFFTGLNPLVVRQLFESDPYLAAVVQQARITSPWLWDFGPRCYLVCAVVATKRI